MKSLDRLLQRWRISKAKHYIAPGARVLDIGCSDGALFKQFKNRVGEGIGIDPHLSKEENGPNYRLLPGSFPEDFSDNKSFDAITLFAMLEHVKPDAQKPLAEHCAHYLKPGGYLILSVPSPMADKILDVLKFFRVLDGMDLDQHYGFEVSRTPSIFESAGLKLVRSKKFQLGLNNLFVFQKLDSAQDAA